jgi:hypothetical protein
VFHPSDGVRSGVLVWVGKGRGGAIPDGARVITHHWPASRQELGDLLRSSEYLISFDAYTALVHEATMCGCPVVVHDDGNWSLEKSTVGPMRLHGVVGRVKDLPMAQVEVRKAYQAYMDYLPEMGRQLEEFIRVTQSL